MKHPIRIESHSTTPVIVSDCEDDSSSITSHDSSTCSRTLLPSYNRDDSYNNSAATVSDLENDDHVPSHHIFNKPSLTSNMRSVSAHNQQTLEICSLQLMFQQVSISSETAARVSSDESSHYSSEYSRGCDYAESICSSSSSSSASCATSESSEIIRFPMIRFLEQDDEDDDATVGTGDSTIATYNRCRTMEVCKKKLPPLLTTAPKTSKASISLWPRMFEASLKTSDSPREAFEALLVLGDCVGNRRKN